MPATGSREHRPEALGLDSDAVVGHAELDVPAGDLGGDRYAPLPAPRSTPWRTAFSTRGCTDIAGTTVPRVDSGRRS